MRALARAPVEATAFLFTDIVDSTLRWERDRDAMQEALRRHDALMRRSIEACGGKVFKTIGDAFCAAFDDVASALQAAIAAQRGIAGEDWKAIDGLRVRMAIHYGETDRRDGDFFGPATNRVARMLAAAHGGQVLVSGVAADAGAASLPPGVALRSLGMLPMRGVPEPERVLQVVAPGMQSQFPPLRAIETPPNNLPNEHTSFVGRLNDLHRVEELLRTGALLTIVGTGGIGKTRLALAAAAGVLADTRDGAWFVDLSSLSDADLVDSAILTALGADRTSDRSALESLVAYLRARDLVLLLDNCEHVVGEVNRVVSAIAANCPRVVVLATSREPIGVPGERVYRLSSLSESEAVELFVARAAAVNPSFVLNDATQSVVANLCRRFDGIALAIELAAARMRSMSITDLLKRLRLRALEGGPRGAAPRQQTMRAVIDWSYNLLTQSERELFCRLSIFSGGFTLESLAGVLGSNDADEWELLDALTSLVDKSLLVVALGEPTRYRLLQPLCEFATEQLDASGETAQLIARHGRTFEQIATRLYEQWDTAPELGWVARSARDLDNFRSALEWACGSNGDAAVAGRLAGGIAPLFLRLSLLREGIGWCERALERAEDCAVAARLNYGLSMLYHNEADNVRALSAAERCAHEYRLAGDERGLTRALSQMAHHMEPSSPPALEVAAQALERARALGDFRLLAATLQRCAFVYLPADMESARRAFEESVGLFRALERDDETARALTAWADAENSTGSSVRAIEIANEAVLLAADDGKVFLTNILANCYVVLEDRERALPAAREAFQYASQLDHPVALPCAVLYLAALESARDPLEAARLAGYARSRLEAVGWTLIGPDRTIDERLSRRLATAITQTELAVQLTFGAGWSDEQAAAHAARV